MPSIAVSLTSYLLCISISVVIFFFFIFAKFFIELKTSFTMLLTYSMITSEDKCLNMRNVKFKFYFFPKMRYKFLMFITTVNFLFLLRLLVQYNYSADHSDLEALTGPKHYLKSFHYPWQEPRICGEKGFFFFGFSRFYIDRVLGILCPCQTLSRRDWTCL